VGFVACVLIKKEERGQGGGKKSKVGRGAFVVQGGFQGEGGGGLGGKGEDKGEIAKKQNLD